MQVIGSTMSHKSIMCAWKLAMGSLPTSVRGLEVKGNRLAECQFGALAFGKTSKRLNIP
jgi:hypothetical protein